MVSSLLHDANGVVVPERLYVGLQYPEVGVGHHIMQEIDHVIPDVHVGAQWPTNLSDHPEKICFGTGFEIVRETTFDAAQPDHHIVPGLDILGWRTGILVGQCADKLIRKLLFNSFGHLVDKPDDQSDSPLWL